MLWICCYCKFFVCHWRVLGCSKRIAWEDHVIFNVMSANLVSGWCKIYNWSPLFRSRLLQSWKAPSHLSTWYFKKLSMGWLRDVKTQPTTRWVVTASLNLHAVRVFGYTRCWNYDVDAVTCGRIRLLSWISKEGFVMESRSAENWLEVTETNRHIFRLYVCYCSGRTTCL